MTGMRPRIPALLAAIVATLLTGGCTVGPDFVAPAMPPATTGYAVDGAGRAALGEGPGERWWMVLGSPALDALVTRALTANASLEASRATLASARQRIAAAAGRSLPQIDANARGDYQQINLSAFGLSGNSPFGAVGNPRFDLYTLGGGVSYDLDLFGRNRRALEGEVARAEAQLQETEAAHLTIAGRVVTQVLAIAALNDRIATERELLAEGDRTVSLTDKRRRAGVGTLVEVLSAQGQLTADRAELPQLEQSLAEGRAMLAVLLGISPAELGQTAFRLDDFRIAGTVPVALPSALVRRRPDILAAEARLHAATAAVGVATANLYPDVTLGAALTQSTSLPGRLLSGNSSGFDLFAGLTAPIFHGGTLTAARRGAEADARAAEATYRQTVIEAFGQVSALLSALDNDARALATARESAEVASRSRHLSRRSFEVGNSGILQVLEANRTWQRARLALVDARARQVQDIARLIVATAAGWTLPERTVPEQAIPGQATLPPAVSAR